MRERRAAWLVSALALVAVVGGGALVVLHWPDDAPRPITGFTTPEAHPQGPTATPEMSAADMDPGTIFVPSLDVYAPIEAVGVSGGELEIPADPAIVGRHEGTAPFDASDGATFLAGHVQAGGADGALVDLARIGPGARIYTRDDDGAMRAWAVTELEVSEHKVMEADHFATSGERRLIVVTCTGPVVVQDGRRGFRDSVIVTAAPVDT